MPILAREFSTVHKNSLKQFARTVGNPTRSRAERAGIVWGRTAQLVCANFVTDPISGKARSMDRERLCEIVRSIAFNHTAGFTFGYRDEDTL
jgi:hypothetical protein